MLIFGVLDQTLNWWDSLGGAQQVFFGIGVIAAFTALVMGVLGFVGMEHHDAVDVTQNDFDHGGGGIFSIKPLTGFFLGFGWAGGVAISAGLQLIVALACAVVAGSIMMAIIVAMLRLIYSMRSDGTMRINDALGAIGTVYITLPPEKTAGGQVTVAFRGRQETLGALNASSRSVPSGEKVKVVQIVDGRTVLVEPLT